MHDDSLAQLLAAYMERMNYTADRLAAYSHVPRSSILRWLNEPITRTHSWRALLAVGAALQLTSSEASQLLQAAGHPALDDLRSRAVGAQDRQLLAEWSGRSDESGPALERALTLVAHMPRERVPQPAPLPFGSRLPLARSAGFVGRTQDLAAVARLLADAAVPALGTVALTGVGGLGKSLLALEFAHRYGQYFAGGVFWINCADPDSVPNEVAACGGPGFLNLHPEFGELSRADQLSLVRVALSAPVPRLLIFDNCEDEAVLVAWRPTTGGCRGLLTGRRSEWAATLGLQRYPLEALARPDSAALLVRGRPDIAPTDPALDAIAASVGDLPLALNLAAGVLAQQGSALQPETYLAQLRAALAAPDRAGGLDQSVDALAQTFALSFDQLDPRRPVDALALGMLARLAHFAPGELVARPLLHAAAGVQPNATAQALLAEDALFRLGEHGLIATAAAGELRMHRLIGVFTRSRAHDPAAQAAVERALLALVTAHTEAGTVPEIVPHEAHLRSVIEAALPRRDARAADLCEAFGYHLLLVNQTPAAERYVREALAIRETLTPAAPGAVAAACNLLGLIEQALGCFDDARAYLERAHAIWNALLDPMAPDLAVVNDNLGHLKMVTGELREADAHLRQALRIHHAVAGLRSTQTARALNNLGYLHVMRGRYRSARRYLSQALALREQLLPAAHIGTAQTLNNLGEAAFLYGDYDAAERYHRRSLEMRQQLFGERHHDVAESLWNLARLAHVQGAYDRALAQLDRALAIDTATVGAEFFETALNYDLRGLVLLEQGDFAAAERELRHALAIVDRDFGPDHFYGATARHHLGLVFLRQDVLTAAWAELEQALRLRLAVLSADHPSVAESHWALAQLLGRAGDPAAAADHLRQARASVERWLAPQHPLRRALAAHGA